MTDWFTDYDPQKDAETVRLAIKAFATPCSFGPKIKRSKNGNRLCVECDKEFKEKHNSQVTCSNKCRDQRKKRQARLATEKSYKKMVAAKKTPKCRTCGKEFERTSHTQFCSEPCRKEQNRISAKKYQDKKRLNKIK